VESIPQYTPHRRQFKASCCIPRPVPAKNAGTRTGQPLDFRFYLERMGQPPAGVSERSHAVGAVSHPSKNEGWGTRLFQRERAIVHTYSPLRRADVEFVWDERKNQLNQRKHGVSFETARTTDSMTNPLKPLVILSKPMHFVCGTGIQRSFASLRMTPLINRVDEEEEVIRIFSARKATRRERSRYAQSN
jgi:uncharacterized protein